MTASAGFVDFVKELLAPLGPIAVKRMFGGAGVYAGGLVFAFIDQDTLYFKTDEAGRRAFEDEGTGPFTYQTKHGEGVLTSYWRVPERLFDEPEELAEWARRAIAVQARASAKKGAARPRAAAAAKKPRKAAAKKKASARKR